MTRVYRGRRPVLLLLLLLLLLTITAFTALTGADVEEEARFTLHIRAGAALTPHKLTVLRQDAAVDAALRFCRDLLLGGRDEGDARDQANLHACVHTVGPAVQRRMDWAHAKRSFMPVAHEKEALVRAVEFDAATPRFGANSPTELRAGVNFLRRHGYAVFKNVGTPQQVDTGVDLMWDYLEALGVGIQRSAPSTWDSIPTNEYGILLQFGIGQSDAMWHIRSLANVHKIFSAVWGTEELIVDFGGAVIFRPLVPNCTAQRWRTAESWFHVDQNAKSRPGMQTIQGAFMLSNQTPDTGGLIIIPESWKHHEGLVHRATKYWGVNDDNNHFLLVPPGDKVLAVRPRFVAAEEGDLVLWDSRTVHCNTAGTSVLTESKEVEEEEEVVVVTSGSISTTADWQSMAAPATHHGSRCNASTAFANITRLKRLAALVSMAPRSMATEQVLVQRRQAVRHGQTTTHWPFLFVADDPGPLQDIALSPIQEKLIG